MYTITPQWVPFGTDLPNIRRVFDSAIQTTLYYIPPQEMLVQ